MKVAISKETKFKLVKEFGKNEHDTGSTVVQIAILTEEIKSLTEHMINNKKDFISKRGLHIKVSKRKKLLNYLKQSNIDEYRSLLKKLNLRGN